MNDPEKSLALTIKTLSNQFHRYMVSTKEQIKDKIDDIDKVTELQGRIVSYLYALLEKGDSEAVYQKDIERFFSIRRSTATVILKRMEKNQLIVRKVSKADGRMKAIMLTQKARDMYPVAYAEFLKAEARAKEGLTEEEVETFLRLVNKILKNIT